MRINHRFYIYVLPEERSALVIASEWEINMKLMCEVLHALWEEKAARLRLHLVRFMAQPPQIYQMADQVTIWRPDGRPQVTLCSGLPLHPDTRPRVHRDWKAAALDSNILNIRQCMEFGLKNTKWIGSYYALTLRVKFGTFIFDRWNVQLEDSKAYPLDDFWRLLLLEDGWQGRVVPGYV